MDCQTNLIWLQYRVYVRHYAFILSCLNIKATREILDSNEGKVVLNESFFVVIFVRNECWRHLKIRFYHSITINDFKPEIINTVSINQCYGANRVSNCNRCCEILSTSGFANVITISTLYLYISEYEHQRKKDETFVIIRVKIWSSTWNF